jgi:hypothetical protein
VRRRTVLAASAAAPVLLGACDVKPVAVFADIPAALRTLETLPTTARMAEGWTLAQVLEHAAQSIEFSLRGFPQLKPAWFSATVGKLAFATFDARGRMNHGLSEPIPGAPALAAALPVPEAVARLTQALKAFDAHTGALRPHFAYGALDKGAYARAHLMHLADHWQHFVAT